MNMTKRKMAHEYRNIKSTFPWASSYSHEQNIQEKDQILMLVIEGNF